MVQKGSKDPGRVTAASKNTKLTETQTKSWDLPVHSELGKGWGQTLSLPAGSSFSALSQ